MNNWIKQRLWRNSKGNEELKIDGTHLYGFAEVDKCTSFHEQGFSIKAGSEELFFRQSILFSNQCSRVPSVSVIGNSKFQVHVPPRMERPERLFNSLSFDILVLLFFVKPVLLLIFP